MKVVTTREFRSGVKGFFELADALAVLNDWTKVLKPVFISICFFISVVSGYAQENRKIIANPLNLNYRFMMNDPSRREAADPVIELFKGKYYLFASKSGGYWSSPDLAEWTYILCKTISTIENYAPTVLVLGDTLYYLASGSKIIHYTTNPDKDEWRALENCQYEFTDTDPAFFHDEETGRVYVYFGCSNKGPIRGVEVLPAQGFKAISKPIAVIDHHTDIYGWEIPGEKNEKNEIGWNEGSTMLKYKGKYYLQYASPGTEYRTYADGVYVGDSPLGPFKYMENSPFSIKPGGFIAGAGHGHTFKDKYGNFWHIATMKISQRHNFERRVGLFPVYFDEQDDMYAHTLWSDYPFFVPDKKVDFASNNLSMNWHLLSYNKKVSASSFLPDFEPKKAANENIENWWSAKTGNAGEWWQVDLGEKMAVNALQVNFADHDFTNKAENSYVFYQYRIESSDDGNKWKILTDRTKNIKDMPHETIVLEKQVKTRFLRITNTKTVNGKFSISGFRVFGKGNKKMPTKVSGLTVQRETDKRRFSLQWNKQPGATGYYVRWGVKPNRLNNAAMVFDNEFEAGYFNRDSEYYFSVTAF
ncbi:MAG: family 43 glycosylhydrolase [Tannerella sp.]|jgi:hypothetical protein|nr:family 43 glycosylhydrolase [Tannerella sp.]